MNETPNFSSMTYPTDSYQNLILAAEVHIRYFRGLPIQIKIKKGQERYSCPLPARFQKAYAYVLLQTGANGIKESEWAYYGHRNGLLKEVAEVVIAEMERAIDLVALVEWERKALQKEDNIMTSILFGLSLFRNTAQVYLA